MAKRAVVSLAYVVMGVFALAGVALSIAYTLVSTDVGRRLVVPRVLALANASLAGRIELDGLHLRGGGLELRGARVLDPDGDVVLRVDRATVQLELARLRSRVVGARIALDRPVVVLKVEPDGGLSLARAFAPRHPRPRTEPSGPFTWTVRVPRLTVRGGEVRYVDADGRTAFHADALAIDGRAIYAEDRAALDLSLRGQMHAPEEAPLSLDAQGGLRGTALRVRTLRVAVGDTALDLVAEVDRATWRGRAAVLALAVDADQVRTVAPHAPLLGHLAGTLYAESDGERATAGLSLAPRDGGGTARAGAAVRLPPGALAAGGDLHLDGLDLGRVLRGAPATALTLDASVRATGADLASLRGAAALTVARSTVRGARLGPVDLRATADRGLVEVQRLDAAVPGATLHGHGRWRRGGEVAGAASLDASSVATARAELSRALGRPLPPLDGAVRLQVELAGTEAAARAALHVDAPRLAAGGVAVSGARLDGTASGPLAGPTVEVDGGAARAALAGVDVRALRLHARVAGRAGEVSLTGAVAGLGPEALALRGAGALSPDGRVLELTRLELAWPEARFALEQPAHVDLAGPSVDRLALAAGAQRLAVAGGLVRRGRAEALDARVAVSALDLASVPHALLPARLGLAGTVDAEVRATGAPAAPTVEGRLEVKQGAAAGVEGLSAVGEATYDGAARRVRFDLGARRAAGGELAARGDLPVALARAPHAAPLTARVTLRGIAVGEALRRADVPLGSAVDGTAGLELELGGTAGAPTLVASADLADGRYGDLDGLAIALRLEEPGREARLVGRLERHGARVLDLEARVPVDLAALARDPGAVGRAALGAPLRAVAEVPGLDLAWLAGRYGIPADARGLVTARAEVTGTLRAPRGDARVESAGATLAGYPGVAARVTVTAREGATALDARLELERQPVLHVAASVAVSPERLGEATARERAPLEVALEIPRADLRRVGAPVPLAGEVSGTARLTGTLSAPKLAADLSGRGLLIDGHPLGDLAARASSDGASSTARLDLAVASGGTLTAGLDLATGLGLPALRGHALGAARASAWVKTHDLDLGFLPAVAPGVIRSAAGKLQADVRAAGALAHLVPRGTIGLAGGQVAVAEWGDWTDIALAGSITEDDLRIERLDARRGGGKLHLDAQVTGLARRGAPADLALALRASDLAVPHAGQVLATVDLEATATGTVSSKELVAEVMVPSGTVKLPNRIPRKIQPLDKRADIVVAPFGSRRVGEAAGGPSTGEPYHVRVHLLAPNHFHVKSDKPAADVELRADVTADVQGGPPDLTGNVQTLMGRVEPIGGRAFDIKRARIEFTGAEYDTATLDVQAVYDNPSAKVTVTIAGTIAKPDVKLTSDPPMDEAQIALLLATGHTELRPGTGGVNNPLDAQAAGVAAVGALSGFFVKDVLGDKLPVDTVSLDSSQLRAGKYISDKVYVGYTRRMDARIEADQNVNEVQLMYQISRQWNFEFRVGDAGSGGASLIWSKDY